MKFRQAKKIIYNTSNRDYGEKYRPYTNKEGKYILPSLANLSIIQRARKIFIRHYKKYDTT